MMVDAGKDAKNVATCCTASGVGNVITIAAEKSLVRSEQLSALLSYQSLTVRELDILLLLVQGKRNQQIADNLCIAVRTVEVHRSSLMKKFNAKTIAELVLQYGLAIN